MLDRAQRKTVSPIAQAPLYFNAGHGSRSSFSDVASPASSDLNRVGLNDSNTMLRYLQHAGIDGSEHDSPGSIFDMGSVGELPAANESDKSLASQADDGKEHAKDGSHGSESTPAWAELKTKAGKDRKRLPLACITCRRKKIRCSGEKPACKHCQRSRIPCVYKVTTRKAAPRTDYMAMLDKRLKRMEERVIKIMPKDDQRNLDVIGRAVVKPAQPGTASKSESRKRVADDAFSGDLDTWAKSKGGASGVKGLATQPQDDIMTQGAEHLPSPEIQQHLAEVFFDYVYGQVYHVLHKPSYMRKLEAGQLPPVLILSVCGVAARFSTHPDVRTEPVFLCGEQWAEKAREIALKRYDTPNITILICYILLGLHEFGTCQGGRSWMLGGMAQRMAYALQLHKDLDHPPAGHDDGNDLTFTDREIRRRTMWACFIMDRFNSSGTDRPLFVAEANIDTQLPISEQYFQMEIDGITEKLDGTVSGSVDLDSGQIANPQNNMGVAAYIVRAVSLWGNVVRYINLGGRERDKYPMWSEQSGFYDLRRSIAQYKSGLPPRLQWTEENLRNHATINVGNQFIFMHIIYQQVILFMNRFALPISGSRSQNPKDMPPEFLTECARAALDAASQISMLVHRAHDYRVVAPFAGYSAFLSSTVHIQGLSSRNPAVEASAKQYLAWNVKFLSSMKKHWGMFYFVTENLRDLYRRQMDTSSRSQQGTAAPAGTKPSEQGIFQYGDWFDRYPHGVSGTEYEEGSNEAKKEQAADALFGQKADLQSVEEFFSKIQPQNKNTPRKAAKRKQSKSTESPAVKASSPSSTTPVQQHHHQRQSSKSHNSQPDQMDIARSGNSGMQQFAQNPSSSSFIENSSLFSTSGLQNELTAMQQPQQPSYLQNPGIMSQLDRHMVLSSYAGGSSGSGLTTPGGTNLAAAAAASSGMNFGADVDMNTNPAAQFNFDLSSAAMGNSTAQQQQQQSSGGGGDVYSLPTPGTWNDPNALSWFMPFNVEPPSGMGDIDQTLFGGGGAGGNYDFGALGMGVYGDDGLGGMEGMDGRSSAQGR